MSEDKKPKILVVDDQRIVRRIITTLLEKENYLVEESDNGYDAIEKINKTEYDLIITDIMMPEMDGYELCKLIKDNPLYTDIPVIIITSKNTVDDLSQGFEAGANDYLPKPFNNKELLLRIKNNLKLRFLQNEIKEKNKYLSKELEKATNDIKNNMLKSIMTLSRAIDAKDHYTYGHCDRVISYTYVLSKKLNLSKVAINNLKIGAVIHDIGKIGISDTILNKPGKLTKEEFEIIKTHPSIGYEIVQPLGLDHAIIDMIIHHHERWDGTGYPHGQLNENILLETRILSLADVYDALRSKRPYRDILSFEETKKIITDWSGSHFDPELVKIFFDNIDEIHAIERDFKNCKLEENL